MDIDDFVTYRGPNGNVKSMGLDIRSDFLKNDVPICRQSGGGAGAASQNLVVPAGLLLLSRAMDSNTKPVAKDAAEEPSTIGEDLYSKLLTLAGGRRRQKHSTRKHLRKKRNSTRKRRSK